MVIITSSNLFAGAWTMEKNKSYHRFAANYYFADKEFDQNGESRSMVSNSEFRDFNLNYYVEYGILDQLTAIASLYYKDLRKEDYRFIYDTRGVGDFDLGLRYQLHSGKIGVFSVQGMLKVPELYDEDDALALGNGQYDYEIKFLYGRSLYPIISGYVNFESAYRWRAEEPADEFRYLIEVGSDLGKEFYTRAKIDGLINAGNGSDKVDNYGNPTATFEYDLTKLDLTIGYKMTTQWGLELGYTTALWGESTAKGDTWTLALSFQP
ncbi:MAG: hypothetical protein HQK68_11020 [Desulfamplus sp.]|nr:hypothetical protein [Desulfamplus sp.]